MPYGTLPVAHDASGRARSGTAAAPVATVLSTASRIRGRWHMRLLLLSILVMTAVFWAAVIHLVAGKV